MYWLCAVGLVLFTAENKQPSLLLWGDSHANMYLSALTLAAKMRSVSGYIATQAECRASLPNQPSDLTGTADVACRNFNNEVNIFLANNPPIRTVIIARQWLDGDSFNRTIQLLKF